MGKRGALPAFLSSFCCPLPGGNAAARQAAETAEPETGVRNGKSIAALIVAAGRGTRLSPTDEARPKQYLDLAGTPVLARSIAGFAGHEAIDTVLAVIGPEDDAFYADLPPDGTGKVLPPVTGGATRQLSVLKGLEALEKTHPDLVLIHDGARPIVPAAVIDGVIAALDAADAALPATPVIDTIKRSQDGRTVGGTEDRTQLFAAQTPQGFAFDRILGLHRRVREITDGFTDDTAIAEWGGVPVALSEGSADNIKITLPGDLSRAAQILKGSSKMQTRIGNGYDVHPFVPGDAVILGGVTIPHDKKLKGHSDADAGLHVLTDALLGALAEGDIGTHFPPSEEKWRGEPSRTFLGFAAERVAARGGRIVNLDLTIVAERPKIGPHVAAMRENIARICGIDISRVSVKATTSEKMGFVGREEGIATIGSASVELPE